jgi:hypothetical protein
MVTGTRQPGDGQGNQKTGDPEYRQRPPHRHPAEADQVREVDVHPVLKDRDELQEVVGGRGHRYAENGGEEQEPQVGRR